jgi:hypothetical protein
LAKLEKDWYLTVIGGQLSSSVYRAYETNHHNYRSRSIGGVRGVAAKDYS